MVIAAAVFVGTAPAGAASPGFVPASPNPVPIPSRAGVTDQLQISNWWRSFAKFSDGTSLAPMAWSADRASSAQNHVDYLAYLRSVGSTYCGHETDPAHPPQNALPRNHNVLYCGMDPVPAIDGWMATPLHGGPFVDPRTNAMGLGWNAAAGSAAGFTEMATAEERVAMYPGPDGVLPLLRWGGREIPNPAEGCPPDPGVLNGAPVILSLPATRSGQPVTYRLLSWSLEDDVGATVPACMMNWVSQVPLQSATGPQPYLFARRPFVQGMRYRARVSLQPLDAAAVAVGSPIDLDWHFTAINHKVPRGQRLLDTRDGYSSWLPSPAPQVRELGVAGRFGVPGNASGVVLNVTATAPTGSGFLTVWPCGAPQPLASNLNVRAGETVPNLVVVRPGAGGKVCTLTSTPTHVLVDLQGWMPSAFSSTAPTRVLETRAADGQIGYSGAKPAAGQVIEVALGANAPVGQGSAAVLNLTATEPVSDGFVTAWPCGTSRPLASNLNYRAGQTRANAVVVAPGTGGKVCVLASASTHLVVDVAGSIQSGFTGTAPVRKLDTRPAPDRLGYTGDTPAAGSVTRVALGTSRPAGATAAVLNVTATNPTGEGYVTVWPCEGSQPVASNLNYRSGDTVANLAMVAPGASGDVCIYSQRRSDLVVDLLGWQT